MWRRGPGSSPGPSLIPALNAIQARLGWLPREELEELARDARRPRYEIEGLISFYPHFRTEPPAKVALHVCHDLPCFLRDGEARLAELRERYGDDAEVELVEVSCLGRCDVAPAVAVNERPAPVGTPTRSSPAPGPATSARAAGERARRAVAQRPLPGRVGGRRALRHPARAAGRRARRRTRSCRRSRTPGCAGWAAPGSRPGRSGSWSAASSPATSSTPICNADESEPGTFKDRQILATQPHLVLEGLLLGMAVVGAEQGWVFIRHEYGPEEHVLRAELDALRAAGVIGPDACGSGRRLDVEVFVSPGGYILGEETALLECMEGHRGEPRNKPPFPGNYGLHGRPTLINSVETFADVPVIVQRGAQWWADQGAGDSVGLEVLRRVRARRAARRLLRADGHHRARADRAGRRGERRPGGRGGAAGRGVVELHRAGQAGHAAGLRRRGGERHDARLGGDGRAGRGHRPAGRVDQRAAVLPQRVVRQVRAVPGGLDQGARDPA